MTGGATACRNASLKPAASTPINTVQRRFRARRVERVGGARGDARAINNRKGATREDARARDARDGTAQEISQSRAKLEARRE